jgi:hypothetical protein
VTSPKKTYFRLKEAICNSAVLMRCDYCRLTNCFGEGQSGHADDKGLTSVELVDYQVLLTIVLLIDLNQNGKMSV